MNNNDKALGYYLSLGACVLAVATAICYFVLFSSIEYKEPVFDMMISIIMAVSGVVGAVLLLMGKKTAGFGPAVLCLGSGISLLMFVKMVIWPVADTIYGIEPFPQFTQLVICAVMFVLSLVVSEVVLYMKKYKTND